jgi:rubrerythrin
MAKKSAVMIVLGVTPKGGPMPEKGSREASMRKLNKMAAEEAAYKQEEDGEGADWKCPDCGTVVMATMPKKSMKCPCCGADMEEDEYEGEESEDEMEDE